MEELQDALEDAQYVNAINFDEGPRPIVAWDNPSDESLTEWKRSLIQSWENDPDKDKKDKPFEFEWTLARPLGLFFFSSYVKEICGDHVRMCFIEEVLRWRCLRGKSRGLKLRKIYERYLLHCPHKVDEETNIHTNNLPFKTNIDEMDMFYTNHGLRLGADLLETLIDQNIDDTCKKCCLGVDGPLRDDILELIDQALSSLNREVDSITCMSTTAVSERLTHMPDFSSVPEVNAVINHQGDKEITQEETPVECLEPQESPKKLISGSRSIILSTMPDDLFDKIEQVILECIRRKYWNGFVQKGVAYWDKFINFSWHESQPVVDDDFFLMRVLGRGGFGLVTGRDLFDAKYIFTH